MFPTYNSLAEVPEAFREHYVMKGGRAVAEVSSDHPLVVNNAALKTEKETAEQQRDEANRKKGEAESALASASVVPRGHDTVPKGDAELVRAVKEAGVTSVEAFNTLKTEHGDFKQKAEEAEKSKHAASVGEVMGWDKEKTALLVPAVFDLSQVQIRDGADGKKEAVAKVKQSDGSLIEKSLADVVKTTPALAALQPSLAASSQPTGTPLPGHGAGGGSKPPNVAESYFASVDAPPKPRQAAA
jgi:hypothetical protein